MFNYIGPDDGEGFQMYQDGEQTVAGSVKYTYKHASPGDGRVVLGDDTLIVMNSTQLSN